MYYEENYMTYIEDEGCCSAVMLKLRKKRHFIMITLLLISAMVSIVAGLYNGFIVKKYSDFTIIVGIFFPSVILVLICVYLAFICGRESFRSSVLSRIRHLSGRNRSHHDQDTLQYPETNSTTRNNLRRNHSKSSIEFVNDSVASKSKTPPTYKIDYLADDSVAYCDSKVSRRHFRRFSGSDISNQMHRNTDVLFKKRVPGKVSKRIANDNENSPTFRGYQDITKYKEFKRSVSDTTHKNRYGKSREDKSVRNAQSINKLRRNKENSLADSIRKSDSKFSCEVITKDPETLHPRKNSKNTKESGKTRFNENYDGRHKSRQEYVNASHQEDNQRKSCCTKSEIRLYSSSFLKPSYEYKQTLHFSSFHPGKEDLKGETASCFSSGDEKASSFSRSDTLEMERKSKRPENFSSEQDTYRLRRKTIYFPSTSNKESTQTSREYAHEYCRYPTKEKRLTQQPLSRNERNFKDHQRDK